MLIGKTTAVYDIGYLSLPHQHYTPHIPPLKYLPNQLQSLLRLLLHFNPIPSQPFRASPKIEGNLPAERVDRDVASDAKVQRDVQDDVQEGC